MTTVTLSYNADEDLSIKEGDQRPTLEAVLERGRIRSQPVDLTDATETRLYVQNAETGDLLINQTVSIVDAEAGAVEYEFGTGDTVQGGRNKFEVVVEWGDGDIESFPKRGYGLIYIDEPLDRELDLAELDDPNASVTVLNVDTLRANSEPEITVEDLLRVAPTDADADFDLDAVAGQDATIKVQKAGTNKWSIHFPDGTGDFEIYNYATTDTLLRMLADTNEVVFPNGDVRVDDGNLVINGKFVVAPDSRHADFDLNAAVGEDATFKFQKGGDDRWSLHFRDETGNFEYYNYVATEQALRIVSDTNEVVFPTTGGVTVENDFTVNGHTDLASAAVSDSPTDPTDVTRLTELETKADLTGAGGVLVSNQVPDLAITETYPVADEAERLALDVEEGDVALQDDESKAYMFTGGDPSNDANWSVLLYPDPPVRSVFGREGDVGAQSGDYSAAEISNFDSAAEAAAPIQSVNGDTGPDVTVDEYEITDGGDYALYIGQTEPSNPNQGDVWIDNSEAFN